MYKYSYVVSIKFEPRSLRHLESKEQTFSHRIRIVCAEQNLYQS